MLLNYCPINTIQSYNDAELLRLMQQDDDKAFTAIYNMHWQGLMDFAVRRLQLQQDAEEVVQDVFINFYERRKELDIHGSLSTYLHSAVRYRIYNKYREYLQKKKLLLIPNLEDVDYSLPELDLAGYKELEGTISNMIEQLPEKCREAFLLSRNEQLSNKEIAERMGISVNTVEKHIGKALRLLRAELGEKELCLVVVLLSVIT